ncbi:hypothetical protein Gotri_022169 [Gossypium trilobum]|uniref:Uncharacterized protein n=1 Tax=Gossypium trilobum TaxID=34281 RepID=A0A7J9DEV9_9ROSI|nr:hypothetical protein [Gossypium trilobum]
MMNQFHQLMASAAHSQVMNQLVVSQSQLINSGPQMMTQPPPPIDSGGIASLVSPCPVTPAVLSRPIFSPSREVLGDMAKEEWGVDGYGLMKELIQLRPPEVGQ